MIKDVSLCAIVRDELMNPAGGIKRFLRAIMPHVEAGVVLDTGSVDGTRQALEEMLAEFANLAVYDRPFDNYAGSRNAALEKVKTGYVLVLDADELITESGFEELKELNIYSKIGFNFAMIDIPFPPELTVSHCNLHNPRLFKLDPRIRYAIAGASRCEHLYFFEDIKFLPLVVPVDKGMLRETSNVTLITSPDILHFKPSKLGAELKFQALYQKPRVDSPPLAGREGFAEWRKFNPRREEYD